MKTKVFHTFLVFLVFNLILPLSSGSITHHYSIPHQSEVLSPDIVFEAGTNGTSYVISTDKTWAEVNVTGTLETTYYEYVLNITNSGTNDYQIKMEIVSTDNISRLTNFTAYFRNGATSKQVEISNGNVTKSAGSGYSIAASTTIYLSLAIKINDSGRSTVELRLHAVKSGTTSPEAIQTVRINIT